MNDNTITEIGAVLFGILLGLFFYGGLWLTVLKGFAAAKTGIWFALSFLLRTGVVVAGFLMVSHGSWLRALCCLLGFAAARFAVTAFLRTKTNQGHAT